MSKSKRHNANARYRQRDIWEQKVMSDTPDWLKKTEPGNPEPETGADAPMPALAFTLAAPPEAVAADPATVRVQSPDNPEQWVDIRKGDAPEQSADDIEAMAARLIAFKRFWQWPQGTREELASAKECAALFIDLLGLRF
jgi:hypothetical protein